MTDRYFDDFAIGEQIVTQGVTLTESMIIDFALRYDPFRISSNEMQRV